MEDPGVVWPWLLATILFLVLLGTGRTVRGRWLGRPPFGAIGSPWPEGLLALGVLLALPGLWWTWQDFRQPAPGLETGFGLGWFGPAAWLLLVASVALSLVWITGAFDWEARGFLFERVGIDHEVGRVAYDSSLPRDPFLGDEPLDLWLYGLGSAEATLALSWWLAIALLYGVCGLGWRLHSHGAGLLAATLFAIVLFTTDRPLFLAPALPATVALLAVMILAVESRGRPNVGHSLVAGSLGGFALISDLGAAAMLLPLLLFGPFWCKLATGLDLGRDVRLDADEPAADPPAPEPEPEIALAELDDDYIKFGGEEKLGGGKKWLPPLKHTAIGAVGLSIPLLPWLARSDAWADDPFYGFRDSFRDEYALRYQPDLRIGYDIQVDYRFADPEREEESVHDRPLWQPYVEATEWGLGLGALTGFGLFYGSSRRRRQTLLYGAPAAVGYGLGAACFGDCDLTHPSSLGLMSVTAGSSLYTMRGCSPPWRQVAYGGTLATGGLAIGLSGATDCGYWDELEFDDWTPSAQLEYRYYGDWDIGAAYRFSEGYEGEEPKIQLRYDTPKLGFDLRYGIEEPDDEPRTGVPDLPATDPRDTPSPEYKLPGKQPRVPGYKPDVRPDINLNRGQQPRPRVGPRY